MHGLMKRDSIRSLILSSSIVFNIGKKEIKKVALIFTIFIKNGGERKFVVHLFLVTLRILLKFQINFQFQ